jgi:alginate biosynthesis protein Alg44
MPQPQIVHEAEIHRQHVRLRIPIAVEIDGTRYAVDDWSMGGFGVSGPITSRQPGERFPVRLIFPFEDFELTLRLEAQMVYVTPDGPRFGCRFVALAEGQLALFRYLVDAYLSGELVTGADVLSVISRNNAAEARVHRLFETMNQEQARGGRIQRYVGLGLILLAGLGLAGLIAAGAYERYLVVTTDDAVIEAPIYALRASANGRVEPGKEGLLHPGDPAARLRTADGTVLPLASPCECVLDGWRVQPGQTAQAGETIATLVAADKPLTVRALVPLAAARRLQQGQVAEVTVPGKDQPYRGQIERIEFRVSGMVAAGPAARDGEGRVGGIPVIIRPDRPFDFEDLGYPVSVRFP